MIFFRFSGYVVALFLWSIAFLALANNAPIENAKPIWERNAHVDKSSSDLNVSLNNNKQIDQDYNSDHLSSNDDYTKSNLQPENQLENLNDSMLQNSSNAMIQIMQTINNLQRQILVLRGQIQEQAHAMAMLKKNIDNQLSPLNKVPQNNEIAGQLIKKNGSENQVNLSEKNLYSQAYQAILDKKFDEAIQKLQLMMELYPNGHYIANGYYWLGEIYAAKGNNKQAIEQFKILLKQYPNSHKQFDGSYKLGVLLFQEGKKQEGRFYLNQVIQHSNQESIITLAKNYLLNNR